ncbi:hypothetical protein OF83DRAFT_1084455 [Amylostereum chailletii]|nr:hypothetical protein OF83DRAFT_1084455 [Amylostereum chailletii]
MANLRKKYIWRKKSRWLKRPFWRRKSIRRKKAVRMPTRLKFACGHTRRWVSDELTIVSHTIKKKTVIRKVLTFRVLNHTIASGDVQVNRLHMPLLAFPNEILVHILEELDAKSLVRCGATCRHMASIVNNTDGLAYKILLCACGMVDGKNTSLTKAQRRRKLLQYESAWGSLSWTECIQRTITFPPGYYSVDTACIGGLLIHWLSITGTALHAASGPAAPQTRLTIHRIPSACRGVDMASWTVDLPFAISEFACDPSQDLLIVVEHRAIATVNIIEDGFNRYFALVDPFRCVNENVVKGYDDFGPNGLVVFLVFDIHQRNAPPAFVFHFPQVSFDYELTNLDFPSTCSSFPGTADGAPAHFGPDPSEQVFHVHYRIGNEDEFSSDGTQISLDVFVPARTLLACISSYPKAPSGRIDVPWEAWGRTGCRIIDNEEASCKGPLRRFPLQGHTTCGTRQLAVHRPASMPGDAHAYALLEVLDFHPTRVARKKCLSGATHGPSPFGKAVASQQRLLKDYRLSDTTLPYTLSQRALPLYDGSGSQQYMLTDDAIVWVSDITADGKNEVIIFSF